MFMQLQIEVSEPAVLSYHDILESDLLNTRTSSRASRKPQTVRIVRTLRALSERLIEMQTTHETPPERSSAPMLRLAKSSCQSCKLRKRKCTRELPECRLCIRRHRTCSYQSPDPIENQDPRSGADSYKADHMQVLRNDFPVAFFLDPVLFNCCALPSAPRHHLLIPSRVEHVLGDVQCRKVLAAEYFKNCHRWMPIISQIRFYGSLMDMSECTGPGIISILLAMKLLLSYPEEPNVCSEIYMITKEFQLRLEMAGHLSIYLLQSAIFVAMYEIGHAIFPGAFVTVSTCARYATTLGINETLPVQGKSWIEQEERNRAWWAILILDRSINLGFRGRHLCRPDPSAHTILPVDDDAWDQGIPPEDSLQNLLTNPGLKTGRYARLAQAVNLLSQVYQHISSREDVLRLDLDSITQLERTLFALEHLASFEERERNICFLSSIATCYSSILLLRSAYLSEPDETLSVKGKEQSRLSFREVLTKTQGMFQRYRDGWGSVDRFPPLALDWLYRAAVAHVSLACDSSPSDGSTNIGELKEALETVSQRWKAATHYLRLLETRQAVSITL